MPKISRIEPCDSRDLVARLEANPKILAKVLEMLELVENAEGDLRRADEAERRVIEILRGTGQEILTGWAEQVAEAVTAEVRAAEPVVVHAKKKFSGIRHTARSWWRRNAFSTKKQTGCFVLFQKLPVSVAGAILCHWSAP